MKTRWWLVLIWSAYTARLLFYATAFPIWEGFDEWAHFSVVRHMAKGKIIVPRDARLPLDVAASFQYVPMPPTLRNLPADAVSHEGFWALSPQERAHRAQGLREMPPDYASQPSVIAAYETLQPPLYYWLVTPVLWLARGASLVTQVFLLRWVSVLIASFAIPLVFAIGRAVFANDRVALGAAAIAALMPELAITSARVANECLSIVLYSALTLVAVRRRNPILLGVLLGLGLITKAYFLAAAAGVALAFFAPRAFLVAAAISGWWYLRNVVTTGTVTGLSEAVTLRGTSPIGILQGADRLPWRIAVDSILFSHLYFGGWSSLMARSWMYHLLYLMIAAAILGLIGMWRKGEIRALMLIYGVFWLAQLYNTVLIFLTKDVPTSMGWYLYAVVGAQTVLAVAGLRRLAGGWSIRVGVILFGLLDVYTMHALSLPYYTGMLTRKANGALAGLRISAVSPAEIFQRLTIFKPPAVTTPVMVVLWALYLAATLALVGAGLWLARGVKRESPPPDKAAQVSANV